jgi:hypothetical protein
MDAVIGILMILAAMGLYVWHRVKSESTSSGVKPATKPNDEDDKLNEQD